jgi:hypothetical protein
MGQPLHPSLEGLALHRPRSVIWAMLIHCPCPLCTVYLLVLFCLCPLRKRYLPTFLRPRLLQSMSLLHSPASLLFTTTQPCMALCCMLPVCVQCMHLHLPAAATHVRGLALSGNAYLSPWQLCSNTGRSFLCVICFIFL